jgi:hypothetical protein
MLIVIGLISAGYGINLIKRGWDHDTLMPGTKFYVSATVVILSHWRTTATPTDRSNLFSQVDRLFLGCL